jgi:hypothetical protein
MRCKLQVGGIYFIKDYHRGPGKDGCAAPLKTYNSYVCRVLKICYNSTRPTSIHVRVLAQDTVRVDIGISDVYYNFKYLSTDEDKPDGYLYRELFVGVNKDYDCLSWYKLKIEDIPLCVSWLYCSDELKKLLL